jgi:hypothetical protein
MIWPRSISSTRPESWFLAEIVIVSVNSNPVHANSRPDSVPRTEAAPIQRALLEFASLQYVTTPVANGEVAIRIIIGIFAGAMPQID